VDGIIVRIEDYGVFVELVPGTNGLLHKSNMKTKRSKESFKLGEVLRVKVLDIDERKRVALTDVD
jgi:polyribonucleotide nucleotidyltransferase